MRDASRLHPIATMVCLSAIACSRPADAPEPPAEPAVAEAPAAKAAPEPEATAGPEAKQPVSRHMWSHYLAALRARDAIIGGHPERAREPLSWLADQAYAESLPDAWRPHAVHVRRAAKRAGEGTDGETAARAIGALGAACGECHAAMGRGPAREPAGFSELGEEDLVARMHRHGWAMERMWEGLMMPWDESYRVGAQVLAEGKLELEKDVKDAAKLRAGLETVRSLGKQAVTLQHTDERAALYGDLISTCAGCHQAQGVELGERDDEAAAEALPKL